VDDRGEIMADDVVVSGVDARARSSISRRALLSGVSVTAASPLIEGVVPAWADSQPLVRGARDRGSFGPVTVFTPPAGSAVPGVKYGRMARLLDRDHGCGDRAGLGRDGWRPRTVVATCENLFDPVEYAYPVFHSVDDGRSWTRVGSVEDADTGAKPRWQPFLYTLPAPFAGLPRGALLCAGNAIPADFSSTAIVVFASVDGGRRWYQRATVAVGGAPDPTNGKTPVWEPFLLLHRGRLCCYYSDQRDPGHAQKLSHQVSTDLEHWGPVVTDQADPVYGKRPGMPTVARLPRNRWIMTWEDGNNTDVSYGVAYKIAADPERFAAAAPHLLRTRTGQVPVGSPCVTWSPAGGRNGTIVVSAGGPDAASDGGIDPLFLNRAGGAPDGWTAISSVVPRGYSRQIHAFGHSDIAGISGGAGAPKTSNSLTYGRDALPR